MKPHQAGPRITEEDISSVPKECRILSNSLNIKGLFIKNRLLMAPMAGYTNLPFRSLVSQYGAGMVATEMVSCESLIRRNERAFQIMKNDLKEKPVSIQLFGSDPSKMAEAASIVEDSGADVIDLNCGCPVKKITKSKSGSSLLRDASLAGKIVSSMVRRVEKPVSVKMRTGWDTIGTSSAEEFAKIIEDSGASFITVHGRTKNDFFTGLVDLDTIGKIKNSVKIPVIGNGDIRSPIDAIKMLERTKVDALMIGRGAIGNPWIFSRLLSWSKTGVLPPPPSFYERKKVLFLHLRRLKKHLGEKLAVLHSRKHIPAYTKGMEGGSFFRQKLMEQNSFDSVIELTETFFNPYLSN
jgi:tRNA-dihydrouridine synthase B